jgi:RNA polymerase sigma-70 factor, ECF subfamily
MTTSAGSRSSETTPPDVTQLLVERLAAIDPQQARIVELRYFGGPTIEDTAEALDGSPATIKREWAVARAWLRRELGTS